MACMIHVDSVNGTTLKKNAQQPKAPGKSAWNRRPRTPGRCPQPPNDLLKFGRCRWSQLVTNIITCLFKLFLVKNWHLHDVAFWTMPDHTQTPMVLGWNPRCPKCHLAAPWNSFHPMQFASWLKSHPSNVYFELNPVQSNRTYKRVHFIHCTIHALFWSTKVTKVYKMHHGWHMMGPSIYCFWGSQGAVELAGLHLLPRFRVPDLGGVAMAHGSIGADRCGWAVSGHLGVVVLPQTHAAQEQGIDTFIVPTWPWRSRLFRSYDAVDAKFLQNLTFFTNPPQYLACLFIRQDFAHAQYATFGFNPI